MLGGFFRKVRLRRCLENRPLITYTLRCIFMQQAVAQGVIITDYSHNLSFQRLVGDDVVRPRDAAETSIIVRCAQFLGRSSASTRTTDARCCAVPPFMAHSPSGNVDRFTRSRRSASFRRACQSAISLNNCSAVSMISLRLACFLLFSFPGLRGLNGLFPLVISLGPNFILKTYNK